MDGMIERRFKDRLLEEFQLRAGKNRRYSLRAFATFLEADHSSLSQIMRGARSTPTSGIRRWAKKLDVGREEITAYIAAEQAPDAQTFARQEHLRHWTAEAMSVVTNPAHWQIPRLTRTGAFEPNSIWISKQIGASVDEVNIVLSRLLRLGLLEMDGSAKWRETTGLEEITEGSFRKIALARVRQKSAEQKFKRAKEKKWETR